MSVADRIDARVFAVVAWTTRRMAGVPKHSLPLPAGLARAVEDVSALGSAEAAPAVDAAPVAPTAGAHKQPASKEQQ